MDVETKIGILRGFAEEILTEDELKLILESNSHPVAYDGFEPSGIAPVHFGLLRAKNVKKMLSVGIKVTLYLADYFAFVNNKLDGDLEKIRTAGEYFVEVWKACGIDPKKVEIIWSKELMDSLDYWDRFMRIGKVTTIERVKRAITVMGRKEGESVSAAQLFYPIMQATDIFQMDIDICQLGIDQRRANVLAREAADKYKWKKPAAVHHPLILGLQGIPAGKDMHDKESLIEYKMSKSNPKSAIYMHDSYAEIKEKVNSAYCPEKVIEGNPILNYVDLLILDDPEARIEIERSPKFGGTLEIDGYKELVNVYSSGKLHPLDLKKFVAEKLEEKIKPVREHFETDKHAQELYGTVKADKITR
ncbi:TPA: tyrosine--tRNA ligase [Candidatus Micrarchaeota archaeon]|nr:tyrosine--tRNA ligase [Candidatus Micrarchaeota archaeon]